MRAVGPSLAQFGVGSPLPDPYLEVHGAGAPNRRYVRFGATDFVGDETGAAQLSRLAGAFPLTAGAGDNVAVVELPPGAHTVVVGSASGQTQGAAMIEVYFLP